MYVDAILDQKRDKITVVERTKDGRNIVEYPAVYTFYYPDPKGKFRTLDGNPVSRFSTKRRTEFMKEKAVYSSKRLYESDIPVVFRCLADNYLGQDGPDLHTVFFDIEVGFCASRGFAPPDDPFNPITAIALYLDWQDLLVCLAIPPPGMSMEAALEEVSEFPNTFLFSSETELMDAFFELIEDADVLSGWNSEGFDIPYMVNRVTKIMGKADTKRFCLLGQFPKPRTYERFGKEEMTYDLIGRIHMDYLQLYKKYSYESRHSYSLDAISEMELGERKVPYEGTLDQLYNRDFREFIRYNRQDTMLVYRIHSKLKYLELANQLAHENSVLLPTAMGSVAMIEMALINEAHERGMVVPDKAQSEGDGMAAAGAYVAEPKKGMHEWVGIIDIASMYPSAIRALNMSPETLVGQVRQTKTMAYLSDRAVAVAKSKRNYNEDDDVEMSSLLWEGLFGSMEYTDIVDRAPGLTYTVDLVDGSSFELSPAEIHDMIFQSDKYLISANGTIFRYDTEGLIPGLLTKWYRERKELQKKLKAATTPEEAAYYDKRQLVKKILLNSAYGALLNEYCRFYDKRIGQSVTLTGRQIVRHMTAYTNELIDGEYDYLGRAIIYNDTDSVMFSAWPIIKDSVASGEVEWSKEVAIQLYDAIAEQVNDSFPAFMERAFHVPRDKGAIISGGREIVGDAGLFIKKKRYAINVIDKEGKRKDVDGKRGSIKVMGLEVKRSDTPKYIQDFLMTILTDVLAGKSKEDIIEHIRSFKIAMHEQDAWTKGMPKAVNKLTYYADLLERNGKGTVPGHVTAALNWNRLKRIHSDNYSMEIQDGMKIVVCKLRNNPLGYTSVAYPVDEKRLPQWFKDLPFDVSAMEEKLVDNKTENLLGVLEWDIKANIDTSTTFYDLFTVS